MIHTPLKTAYNDHCPKSAKRELLLAIRNIDCLNEHLTGLMNLKQLFVHSGNVDIAEYELGKFIRNKVDSLREHATNNQIKLEVKAEFGYASVWFDQSKVSPIVDKIRKKRHRPCRTKANNYSDYFYQPPKLAKLK